MDLSFDAGLVSLFTVGLSAVLIVGCEFLLLLLLTVVVLSGELLWVGALALSTVLVRSALLAEVAVRLELARDSRVFTVLSFPPVRRLGLASARVPISMGRLWADLTLRVFPLSLLEVALLTPFEAVVLELFTP